MYFNHLFKCEFLVNAIAAMLSPSVYIIFGPGLIYFFASCSEVIE
jgi:hypothetical protein